MKKIIIGSILVLVLVVTFVIVGKQLEDKDSLDNSVNLVDSGKVNKEGKKIYNVSSIIDFKYNYGDKNVINNLHDYIAIVHIDSIEGATNWNDNIKKYVSPYTYGKATIISQLKGNIDSKTINFKRLGGEMPFNEWVKGEAGKDKILASRKGINDDNTIFRYMSMGDIPIEQGKTYVAFLILNETDISTQTYTISALQYGLREVDMTNEKINENNIRNLRVKNNDTNEWESITEVVKF